MKIRSITLGTAAQPGPGPALERAGPLLATLAARYADAGYEVQTTRVSLPPLARLAGPEADLPALVRSIDAAAVGAGVGYVALGPVRWSDGTERAARLAACLPAALAAGERVFGSIETADADGVRFEAVQAAAAAVRALAASTERGLGNFRFGALANCPPNVPFFPAAYHEAREPAFSLALQSADLAVRAFDQAETLDQAQQRLTAALEAELAPLEAVAAAVEAELGLRYAGADPTLAPFPDDRESIGSALERLGVGRFGMAGTLTGAALVTRALRSVRGRCCGFAGLILPVLEDSALARSATDRLCSWQELLLYSAVCGTGLDMLPLPGDVGPEELAAMILDVSTLAVTLRKPLTCRLLPVPGRAAGELTEFDSPFFVNAGILGIEPGGSAELIRRGLAGEALSGA
jgi:uncharacterized protein (UPF0210 family)